MRTFDCPKCGWSGHPTFELSGKGNLEACCQGKDCQYSDPTLGPNDFRGPTISGTQKAIVVIESGDEPPSATHHPIVRAPSIIHRQAAASSASNRATLTVTDPLDPIPGIKARRDFLEAEIARLEGYRLEKRKLDRMLSAARREDARQEAARMVIPAAASESN